MILVWIIFSVEIFLFSVIKTLTNNPDLYASILIFIHIPAFLLIIARNFNKELYLYIIIGYFIRLILMYWDIYASNFLALPHSGGDSIGFYNSAISISQDLSLISERIYGGLYAKIIGVTLYLGPTSPIILQYINVLLALFSIIIVYKIMTQIKVNYKIKKTMLILMIFFPSSLIFSSVLLRESMIAFIVIISFYCFLQWVLKGQKTFIILAFLTIILGALFHSGVISIAVGYFFMLLFYRPEVKRFQSSFQTLIAFGIIFLSFLYISSTPLEEIPFLSKFEILDEEEGAIYNIASSSRGGSAYLSSLEISNPIQIIVYAPIKMLYFLISPVPFDWRGVRDIATFFYDGLIYAVLFLYPIFNYRKMIKGDPLTIALFVILLSSVFVFGISLNNSGTAMRHRYKLFYLFVILFSISVKNKKKEDKIAKNIR